MVQIKEKGGRISMQPRVRSDRQIRVLVWFWQDNPRSAEVKKSGQGKKTAQKNRYKNDQITDWADLHGLCMELAWEKGTYQFYA
jgi:DNA primase catalytic subunit